MDTEFLTLCAMNGPNGYDCEGMSGYGFLIKVRIPGPILALMLDVQCESDFRLSFTPFKVPVPPPANSATSTY